MAENTPDNKAVETHRGRALILALLVPLGVIIPFLLFGESIEAAVLQVLSQANSRPFATCGAVVAILAADIVLPVPSSIVGAFAGATLGLVAGMLATWIGLMLGSIAGYWIGRALAGPREHEPGEGTANEPAFLAHSTGTLALVATRAIPVLAEVGIIAAGAVQRDFRRVLLAIAPANLAVAFAYASAGRLLADMDPALVAMLATCLCAAALGVSVHARARCRRS